MVTSITREEAQAKLSELIAALAPGEEGVITKDTELVAKLHCLATSQPRPQCGNCRGLLTIVAEDGEHGDDFTNYMR